MKILPGKIETPTNLWFEHTLPPILMGQIKGLILLLILSTEVRMSKYVIGIDSGTTSCRSIVFDLSGIPTPIALAQKEFPQYFSHGGWLEHDAMEILQAQIECIKESLQRAGLNASQIACVGIANQRDTCLLWDKSTGKPIGRAITWQCRSPREGESEISQHAEIFRQKTGLIASSRFAGPKAKWLLDLYPDSRALAAQGKLAFGTVDTWLNWNLTRERNHFTEPSNASQTALCDLVTLEWDEELLRLSSVPGNMLPKIVDSNALFGLTDEKLVGFTAPVLAVLGDQQAALFGQGCLQEGAAKCTYGTGGFLSRNIGTKMSLMPGLQTAVAWKLENHAPVYTLEGVTFIAGAALQWLRDGIGMIANSDQSEELALSLSSNDGVYFVPALAGLGSPWWNEDVRGTITGLTRSTGPAHLVRAALESMAYQVADMASGFDGKLIEQRVDGGATRNKFLLQFQSDLLGVPVIRSAQLESTVWGVAALAAIRAGLIDENDISGQGAVTFYPQGNRDYDYAGWKRALKAALAAVD